MGVNGQPICECVCASSVSSLEVRGNTCAGNFNLRATTRNIIYCRVSLSMAWSAFHRRLCIVSPANPWSIHTPSFASHFPGYSLGEGAGSASAGLPDPLCTVVNRGNYSIPVHLE